jgi:predicted butyrate kinase (DUF1464 family)
VVDGGDVVDVMNGVVVVDGGDVVDVMNGVVVVDGADVEIVYIIHLNEEDFDIISIPGGTKNGTFCPIM